MHETQSLTKVIFDSNLINFLLASGVLVYFLLKFIPNSAISRKKELELEIANAMEAKLQAELKLQELNRAIEEAKREANSMIASAKDSAENLKTLILSETKEQIIRMQNNAEQEIEQQKSIALEKIKKQVASMVCTQAEAYVRSNSSDFNKLFAEKIKQDIGEAKALV